MARPPLGPRRSNRRAMSNPFSRCALHVALAWIASAGAWSCAATPREEPAPHAESAPARDQSPSAATKPAEEPLATIDGEPISLEEYQRFLFRQYGRRHLNDLIGLRLLEREGRRRGLEVDEAELEQALQAHLATWLDERCKGDRAEFERQLAALGHDRASYGDYFREAKRRELLSSRIIRATRTIAEADVKRRFERDYGPGGVRTSVRDLFLTRQRLATELERQGAPAESRTPDELDRRLLERARDLLAQVKAGASFETLVRTASDDLSSRVRGGIVDDEACAHFGADYLRAVAAAPEHEVQGPLATGSGVHLFEVLERRATKYDEVRALLLERLRNDPPSLEEITALDERLRAAAEIRIR